MGNSKYVKIKYTFLNSKWVKEELTRETRNYFDMNRNKSIIYQDLGDAAKAERRGKFIALNAFVKKRKISKPKLKLPL